MEKWREMNFIIAGTKKKKKEILWKLYKHVLIGFHKQLLGPNFEFSCHVCMKWMNFLYRKFWSTVVFWSSSQLLREGYTPKANS